MPRTLFLTKKNGSSHGLTVHWQEWDVPDAHLSLPALVARDLLDIRTEHASWAYNMGKLPINGVSLAEHLTIYGRLSMWWCSLLYERHPKMTPCLYTLFRLRALEKLMDAEDINVCLTDLDDPQVLQVLKDFCQKTGRRLTCLSAGRVPKTGSLLKRLYQALPAPLRALLRGLHWLVTIKRHFPRAKLSPRQDCASIVTYFPNIDLDKAKAGRFVSHYWENLHSLISQQHKYAIRWLLIRFPSPQLDLQACRDLCKTFAKRGEDGISFHYLEEFLSLGDLVRTAGHYLRLARTSRKLERSFFAHCHFAGSQLNFAPLIASDWQESFRGWRCLERCLMALAFDRYVEETGPVAWTIFPLENCPWERMLTYAVKARQAGPVYGIQHSTIRPTDLRYFNDSRIFQDSSVPTPDLLCPNGQSAASQWLCAGVPPERLYTVEALRYGYLAKARTKKLPKAKTKTLLLVTSFFADETQEHLKLFVQAYAAGLFAGLDCLIKPHPYLDPRPFLPKDLLAKISIGSLPLPNYWQKNILVWASNSTTAVLEAAMLGLPVACMQSGRDFDLSPIQNIPGLVRTASLADVKTMLATAAPLNIDEDYLCLDPLLSRTAHLLFAEQEK
ncbi:MAG: hypothetical protein J5846_02765 [Desulfovibrio sp.]|nr:hypothetical protein [Desulfovibrio sp.]